MFGQQPRQHGIGDGRRGRGDWGHGGKLAGGRAIGERGADGDAGSGEDDRHGGHKHAVRPRYRVFGFHGQLKLLFGFRFRFVSSDFVYFAFAFLLPLHGITLAFAISITLLRFR
jgi:hypothetical protein